MQPPRNLNAVQHNEPSALGAQEAILYGGDNDSKPRALVT
jgi:hypothetical protein